MRPHVALPVVLVLLVTTSSLLAQSSDCTGKETQAQLPSVDPVYVDAMDLARNLIDQGFIVKCVLGSKVQNLFEGQKGAAFYRTDQGSFDVVFLPKAETFDAVQVVEQMQGNLYVYSFRGIPHSPGRMEGGKKTYFIKSANLLFLLWSNADLAESIQAAVSRFQQASPPPLILAQSPSLLGWLSSRHRRIRQSFQQIRFGLVRRNFGPSYWWMEHGKACRFGPPRSKRKTKITVTDPQARHSETS
jgi:hypothetical protein